MRLKTIRVQQSVVKCRIEPSTRGSRDDVRKELEIERTFKFFLSSLRALWLPAVNATFLVLG